MSAKSDALGHEPDEARGPPTLSFDAADNSQCSEPEPLEQVWATPYSAPLRTCNFSHDGRLLACGANDGQIRLFSVASTHAQDRDFDSGPLQVYREHTQGINDLQFHPSGQFLASCSKVWCILFCTALVICFPAVTCFFGWPLIGKSLWLDFYSFGLHLRFPFLRICRLRLFTCSPLLVTKTV